MKKGKYWIGGIIALLIAVRLILPVFALKHLNQYLANFSPLYQIHIEDLHLQLFRMAYAFKGVEGNLKDPNLKKEEAHFMDIKKVDVSIAWHELLRGRFVADVDLVNANLLITTRALDALSGVSKEQAKSDAKNVKDATVPFDLERLRVQDSKVEFSDVAGLPKEENFYLSHVEAVANNLTPTQEDALSMFTVIGNLQETAKIKLVGQMKLKKKPSEWSVNVEMKDFDLRKINPIARRMVPLTFKTGSLTMFSAAQSVQGKMKGYVKPFLKDLVMVGDRGDFKNVGQFLIEIASTIGNFFLKNSKSHALATKVSFHEVNGKMEVDTGKAISLAIKNGFGKALPQSLDETLELK